MKTEVLVVRNWTVLTAALLCACLFVPASASASPPASAGSTKKSSFAVKPSTSGVPTPADKMVSPDKPTAAETRLASFCRTGGFDFAGFFANPKAVREGLSSPLSELSVIQDYAACRDLAGAPQACRVLMQAAPENTGGRACAEMAWEARFARAVIKGGDAARVCRSSPEAGSIPPGVLNHVCASYVEGAKTGRPEVLCLELGKVNVHINVDVCMKEQAFWTGREEACVGLSGDLTAHCRTMAGYVAGLRSPAACKNSRLCSGTCADFAQILSRGFCSSVNAKITKWSEFQRRRREIAAQYFREKHEREAASKRKFKKGQPMQIGDATLRENIKRIEKGLPPLAAPPSEPPAGEPPAGGGNSSEGGNGKN